MFVLFAISLVLDMVECFIDLDDDRVWMVLKMQTMRAVGEHITYHHGTAKVKRPAASSEKPLLKSV